MKKDRDDFYWEGDYKDDFGKKDWKKFKKILRRNEDIIVALLQSKDSIVYKIDYDIEDDKMREDYYINLVDSIIDNYQTVIDNDDQFDVWVNDSEITLFINDSPSNSTSIKIQIFPNSIETSAGGDGSYEFFTTINYHKKYFKIFLEMESYKDFKKSSEMVDAFVSKHKLNRNKDLSELIENSEEADCK